MAEVYSVDQDLDGLEEQALQAGHDHLTAAAQWIEELMNQKQLTFAFMGGYSLILRGSSRTTTDIDVAVSLKMREVKSLLADQERAIVPSIFADVYRIFLWVGGKWGPPDGAEQLVEVDLLPQGAFGVPPSNFSEVVETSARSADGTTIDSSVFSVEFITKSKLRALTDRQDDKDFDDLRFLIQSYPNDINSIADRLNEDGRKNFIDEILERSQDEGFAAVAAKVLKVEKP